jgi:ubiquinol-cytochrome c reductase subunit 10
MSPALRLPGPLRLIGKKHIEIAQQWYVIQDIGYERVWLCNILQFFRLGSAIVFGATAGVGVTYATDWKLILQYLPYYNGKFKEE